MLSSYAVLRQTRKKFMKKAFRTSNALSLTTKKLNARAAKTCPCCQLLFPNGRQKTCESEPLQKFRLLSSLPPPSREDIKRVVFKLIFHLNFNKPMKNIVYQP